MSFQDLPPELIERIVVLLPLHDVYALRLTGKVVATKATQEHFKTHFRKSQLEIIESRLRLFVSLTECNSLIHLLKDLTLIEPVYNTLELEARLKEKVTDAAELDDHSGFVEIGYRDLTADDVRTTERDLLILRHRRKEQLELKQSCKAVELLSQGFANLTKQGTILRQLQTEVVVYRDNAVTRLEPLYGGSWRYIWSAAASVTQLLFSSLAASGVSMQGLNLFNSSRMQRCSLSCNELSNVDYSLDGLRVSLGNLEVLSLSLSDKIIAKSDKDKARSEDNRELRDMNQKEKYRPRAEVLAEATEKATFAGLQILLQKSDQLRELDLLRYSLMYTDNKVAYAHCRGLLSKLESAKLPMLQKLTLQGFNVTEDQLLKTLWAHKNLKRLSLRYITLLEGRFERFLDYCTLESSMEDVELDSLLEPEMVIFETPWVLPTSDLRAQCSDYPKAHCRWLRQSSTDGPDFRIKYQLEQGRTIDTSAIRNWRQDLKNRFGPPSYGKPSCVREYLRPEETWQVW